MTDPDEAGRPLPRPVADPLLVADPVSAGPPYPARVRVASTKEVFGRGLLVIVSEMVQLIVAFILGLFALACFAALAVKANDAWHFMGEGFVTPHVVTNTLGGLLAHSSTYLVICLLAAIFATKLLDLVVRVLQRRARLAEQGYLTL